MAEKSIKKNAFYNVLRTIMSLLFPLITFPYASRILLPEGIGKVNFANSIVSYFGILASLGIGTYGIREAAKRRHDKILLSQFTTELFVLNMASTIVAYILFFIAIFFVPKLSEYRALLCVSSATILFSTIGVGWLYSALEEYGYIALRSVIFQILSIVFLFTFVKTGDDYIKYAAMGVFSSVGSNLCNLVHSRKYLTFRHLGKLNIAQHIKPVFIFFGSTLAISVFTVLDTSMLGFLSSDVEVGYYSAATKLIRMIRDLFPAVFTVVFARLSVYAGSENSDEKFKSMIQNMLNFIMCLGFPIATGLFILGKPVLVVLSGSAYLPALPTMYVMIPVILFSSTAGFLGGTVLNSLGKEKIYLYCVITGAVVNFSLNSILIRLYGSFGAGLATVITECTLMLLYFCLVKKYVLFKKLALPFAQYALATLCMCTVLIPIKLFLRSDVLQLVIISITGAFVYAVFLILFRNEFSRRIFEMFLGKLKK